MRVLTFGTQVALDRPASQAQTYRDLLTKMPQGPDVLASAYRAVEDRMQQVGCILFVSFTSLSSTK